MYNAKKIILFVTIILSLFYSLHFCENAFSAPFMDGSFEIGIDPGEFTQLIAGSTAITGWKVVGENIDYIGTIWKAMDGLRSLDLNGSCGIGGIEQTFDTIAGHWYRVTFWMAGNVGGGPDIKTLKVTVTGNSFEIYAFDIKGSNPLTWVEKTYTFFAHGSTVTLSVISTSINDIQIGSDCWGPKFDHVSVEDLTIYLPLIIK